MKTNFLRKSTLGIALTALWLAGDHSAQLSNAQAQPAPPATTVSANGTVTYTPAQGAPPAPTAAADVSAVPPASVAPPPSILPTGPLAQVIRLVQAGVNEGVILAYATNSTSTFNLDSEKIIYLSDLGVPDEVVSAMMQRDQVLQQQMAAANPPPTPSAPPTAEPAELPPPPAPAEVTDDYFYSSLEPYGSWVDVEGYGRCWRPTLVVYNSGWQPYCDRGHWVYSDCGWYWASDYSWGVTFHYGRWFHNPRLGWCWWPDTVWAPSWVTWRYSDDYCGWAPLPPFAVYRPGVGFVYRGNGVSIGFDFGLAANFFTFVPTRNFCDPHPRRFRVDAREETRIFNRTTVINNFNFDSHNRTIVNRGIEAQHIADATRTPIRPVPVRELGASTGRSWRGGPAGQQSHGPGMTTGNAPHPGSAFDNRNSPTPRGGTPIPNRVSQPGNNQNQQPNRNWPSVTQTPVGGGAGNAGAGAPNRNLSPVSQTPAGSPAQNRFSQPANNPALQPNRNWPDNSLMQTRNNDNKHIASPHGQQFEDQTPHFTPPPASAPVARPQPQNEPRPTVSEPPPRNVAPPSAPPSAPASHESQSSPSSNRSDNHDQNQNGRGH